MKPEQGHEGMTVEGRVVDDTGAGIQGATVRRLIGVGPMVKELVFDRRLILGERQPMDDPVDQVVAESTPVKTDANGRFRLEGIDELGVIIGSAPGFGVGYIDAQGERFPRKLVITLEPAKPAILGVVKDRDGGGPAPGMRVALAAEARVLALFEPWDAPTVGADSEGRFEFVGPPPGRYRVSALGGWSGFRSSTPDESVEVGWAGGAAEVIELEVDRGGSLSVQVIEGRSVVAGARCMLMEDGSAGLYHLRDERHRTAGDDGRCRFEGLSFGRSFRVWVDAAGHVARRVAVPGPTRGAPRAEARVELEPGRTLRGTVRYRDGAPAAGLWAEVLPNSVSETEDNPSWKKWRGELAADGSFEFGDLPVGPAELTVGYHASGWPSFPPDASRKLSVQVGSGEDLEAVIDATRLQGEVVTASGAPVSGAHVVARSGPRAANLFAGSPMTLGTARTGPDGRFTIHALGWTDGLVVEAGARGHMRSGDVPVPSRDAEVRITLQPLARVVGRVIADPEPEGALTGVVFVHDPARWAVGDQWSTRIQSDGRFELEVPPGQVVLQTRLEGYLAPEPIRLDLEPGGQGEAEFRLRAGAVVEGSVEDASGAALAHARVKISLQGPDGYANFIPPTKTNARGFFRFENVPPGEHALSAAHADLGGEVNASVVVDGAAAPDPVLMRFAATGRVSGTVSRAGEPAARVMVVLAAAEDAREGGRAMTDSRGRFELSAVAVGRYTAFAVDVSKLMAQMPGGMFGMSTPPDAGVPMEVLAGQHAVVTLELAASGGARVSGTVKGSSPTGLVMGMVVLLPVGGSVASGAEPVGPPATLGPDGRFQLLDVPSGTYTLAIYMFGSNGGAPIHQQTLVVAGRDQDLSIELPGR